MRPVEIAKAFEEYVNEGTTAKGLKVQTFYSNLPDSMKKLFANNISKAHKSHLKSLADKAEMMAKRKSEIKELKKRAKELGFTLK